MSPLTADLRVFVDIDATAERVWAVVTDLPAYAEWNPFVTHAEGAFVEGTRLLVTVPAGSAFLQPRLRPTVLEVVPLRRLRYWSRLDRWGVPGLFDVEQTITLVDQDGGVRVWLQDRFGGLLAPALIGSLNRHRLPAFTAMTAALKSRVEGTERTLPADDGDAGPLSD